MLTVTVTPLSRKAKNRLANSMGGDPTCVVEQHIAGKMFLRAVGGSYYFWVDTASDSNWKVD